VTIDLMNVQIAIASLMRIASAKYAKGKP
jgi:hypothetical protein